MPQERLRYARRPLPVIATLVLLATSLLVTAQPASAGTFICVVGISDGFVREGNSGTSNLTFVIATPNCPAGATITYTTRDGSATAGSDYTATTASVTVSNTSPTATATVPVVGDTANEFPEHLFVDISSTTVITPNTSTALGVIGDDDGVAKVVVFDNSTFVDSADTNDAESDNLQAALGALGHVVTPTAAIDGPGLSAALAGKDAIVFPRETTPGALITALDAPARQAITDFVIAGGTLVASFHATDLGTLFGHALTEQSPTGNGVRTAAASNAEWSEGPPTVGLEQNTNVLQLASLPAGSTVVYADDGTFQNAGMSASAAGDATVAVIPEGAGSFVFVGWDWTQSNPGAGTVTPPPDADWTSILGAAVQKPSLAVADVAVTEGDSGTSTVTVVPSITHKVSEVVSAAFTTTNGTATAPSDFTASSGTTTIGRGTQTGAIPVSIVGDTVGEPNEALTVDVSAVVAANVADNSAAISIADNDQKDTDGYRLVATDGGVFTFGARNFQGSLGSDKLNAPIFGGATDPSSFDGYWLVGTDGGVFTFNAPFFGSLAGTTLDSPIVEIEATTTGKGYWLVSAKGKVSPFGDAVSYGDTSAMTLGKPIVGMATTRSGLGYWLLAGDGGVFAFGDAGFYGSTGGQPLNAPVIDMGPTRDDGGYYLVAADGGIFTFGNAAFFGSAGGGPLNAPVVSILVTASGEGYWLGASDGGVFTFGPTLQFFGSMGGVALNGPMKDFIF